MQPRVVTHTGTFRHEGVDLSFTRWELQGAEDFGMFAELPGAKGEANTKSALRAKGASVPWVLLHGFAQSSLAWADVAARMVEGQGAAAVYALDFAGHGESARPEAEGPYSMESLCASVRDFCAWVARREASLPVLCGYSMGGRIALETLVRSARDASKSLRVAGLVLEGAGLGPIDESERECFRQRNEAWAQQLCEQGVSAFMEYWESLPLFATQRSLDPSLQARLREGRQANDAQALARTFRGSGQQHQHREDEALAVLEAAALGSCALGGKVPEGRARAGSSKAGLPVCYLAGELDAKYAAVAARVRESCPHVDVMLVPQAGHNAHLEQPAAFTQALAGLLGQ